MLTGLFAHLVQSTLFAGLASLLTLGFRRNRAQVRYSLWLAASVKFLIPFSILMSAGSHLGWRVPVVNAPSEMSIDYRSLESRLGSEGGRGRADEGGSADWVPVLLFTAWAIGFMFVVSSWGQRWLRLRATLSRASRLDLPIEIPVLSSPEFAEPGVYGVCRPILLLPAGIIGQLTPPQFDAVLVHELCHVRRRDNLATAIHMLVEAIFWFYPLVWWLGARLMEERERACDEEVLRLGNSPQVYAEGILRICELYLASPLECVAGVTGANLKKRIEEIMANRVTFKLGFARKAILIGASVAAVALPVLVGMTNATPIQAQSPVVSQLEFEAASVKAFKESGAVGRFEIGGGGLHFTPGMVVSGPTGVTARAIILSIYNLAEFQLSGGPAWLDSDRFELEAKAGSAVDRDQLKLMLQTLMAKRFGLTFRHETKEMPIYGLVMAKNGFGPNLRELKDGEPEPNVKMGGVSGGPLLTYRGSMEDIAQGLAGSRTPDRALALDRPVRDKTGLTGNYLLIVALREDEDFKTAVQEQSGLRFETQKAAMEVYVVEHIERPSEN